MKGRPLIAICVAWVFAAGALFLSGKWIGETNADGPAYAQCEPIDWTGRPGWLCFTEKSPPVIEADEGAEA